MNRPPNPATALGRLRACRADRPGIGCYAFRLLPEPAPGSRDSAALLAVSLPDVDGHPQSLAQWRGRLLVVNFWATWCGAVREEMPMFVRPKRRTAPKDCNL